MGVGNEVNRPLLEQLANEAGGLAAFVSAGDDFERQALAFRRKLTRPAAKQVQLTFEGGQVCDLEPPHSPTCISVNPCGSMAATETAVSPSCTSKLKFWGARFDQTVEVTLPANDESNPQIDRTWASHRVERLLDKQGAGASEDQISEVIRLCEGYSIVSQYPSFLVLENDAEYQRWQIVRRNATRVERDRAAQVALRKKLDELRQQASAELGPQEPADKSARKRGQ